MASDNNNQRARSSGSGSSQLFPLPLNSMERFHLYDQTAKFPNTICSRLVFDGVINPEWAEQALRTALARHPFMGSVVEYKNGKPFFDFQPEECLPKNWHEPWRETAGFASPNSRGLQVVSQCSDSKTAFWFQSSHVLCDGVGAIPFLTDWLKSYHNLHAGRDATYKLRKVDNQILKSRNNLGLLKRRYLRHLWKQPLGLYGTAKFLFRNVAAVTDSENDSREIVDWDYQNQPAVLGNWLDRKSSELLVEVAESKNVSLNALLLARFYVHLASWLRQHRPVQAEKWLRIIHPFNLRDYSHRRMPATNRVAIVQIDRCQKDLSDFDGLVGGLDREISVIRDWELGKLFLIAIRGMSWFPGMLQRSAGSEKCRGTCVFTGLGEPFSRSSLPIESPPENDLPEQVKPAARMQVGDLHLDTVDLWGPVRHGTPINLIVLRHLGRLRLCLHYDPRILDRDTMSEFLSAYCQRLRELN